MITVEIIFDDKIDARAFMQWLNNEGEQSYFDSMITHKVDSFEYDEHHLRIITSKITSKTE